MIPLPRVMQDVYKLLISELLNYIAYIQNKGTAVAQWLRCCATNRKVAGSIPDGVIRIFLCNKILPIAVRPWGRLSL